MEETRVAEALEALRDEISWPDTPDLSAGTLSVLNRRARPKRGRILALVAVAAVVAIGVVLVVPAARDAVAGWLGIRGVQIQRTDAVDALSIDLRLGRPADIETVAETMGFVPLIPTELGTPDGAFFGSGLLTLVWANEGPILLTQFRGDLDPAILKEVPGATNLELVDVNGSSAIWITGAPHEVTYLGPGGDFDTSAARIAGNTLLWEVGEVTLRLEGVADLDDALAIAHSTR
jgi:hypothetical protein